MEKSLYEMPKGIETLEPAIEIEVENPESMSIEIDGIEIDLTPPAEGGDNFDDNLAEFMAKQVRRRREEQALMLILMHI